MSDANVNFPPSASPVRSVTAGEVDSKVMQVKADIEGQVSEVAAQLLDTAKKSEIQALDTKINSQASGSPKGTYATVTALQTAFPTGNTNMYVVSADGKWYYWNGATWTAGGLYQSTGIADKSITPEKIAFIGNVYGKNMLDETKTTAGFISNNTGAISANSLYKVTDFMPIQAGLSYVISPRTRNRMLYDVNKSPITATYVSEVTGNYTFTPTQDGYFRASIFAADIGLGVLQFEKGLTSTSYEPFGSSLVFDEGVSLSAKQKSEAKNYFAENFNFPISAVKKGDNYNIVSKLENGDTIEIVTSKNKSGIFKFDKTNVNGVQIHETIDDITPIRTFNTVGANHGYTSILNVTLSGHGKTTADLGSTWTDGTTVYTLLKITGDLLEFGMPVITTNGMNTAVYTPPIATLTHVLGATNTSSIAITTIGIGQLYPSTNNLKTRYFVDGVEITEDGTYGGTEIQVIEQYNIMDYGSVINYAQTHIGSSYNNDSIEGVVKMSITYTFTKGGKCLVSHGLKALKKVNLMASGFLQSVPLLSTGLTTKRYIPHVKAKSGYDFKTLVDMTNYNVALKFYAADLIKPGVLPNRHVDWLYNGTDKKYGFTMGYIIDKTNSKTADIINQVKDGSYYWDARETKKSYPNAIYNLTMEPGEYKTFLGYRNYLSPSEATNANVVEDKKDTYVYIDYHKNVTAANVELIKHIGKGIEILDSENFTLLNDVVDSEGVTFNITNNYGYAILKLNY